MPGDFAAYFRLSAEGASPAPLQERSVEAADMSDAVDVVDAAVEEARRPLRYGGGVASLGRCPCFGGESVGAPVRPLGGLLSEALTW